MRKLILLCLILCFSVYSSYAFEAVKFEKITPVSTGVIAQPGFSLNSQLTQSYFGLFPSGLTFLKDFEDADDLNADYSLGSFIPTFTASRSATTPATYINSAGVVQSVITSNIPRYQGGYYDATGFHAQKGLMIEAAGTNLFVSGLINSNYAVSGADFQYSGSTRWRTTYFDTGASTLSVVSDSKSYGGKSLSVQVTDAGAASTSIKFFNVNGVNLTTLTAYTISFWVKADAVKTISMDSTNGDTSLSTSFITVADTWIKIQKTWTTDATGGITLIRWLLGNNGLYTIQFEGLQIEANPYATSFIPTTTAALTRNGETLKYAILNNRTAAQESIFIKFVPNSNFANDGVFRNLITTDTKNRPIRKSQTGLVAQFVPNSTDSSSSIVNGTTSILSNVSYVVAGIAYGTIAETNAEIYLNGVSEGTSTTNYILNAWGTNFYVGMFSDGTTQLNGLIQNVAIFNRALSATEVLAVNNLLASN